MSSPLSTLGRGAVSLAGLTVVLAPLIGAGPSAEPRLLLAALALAALLLASLERLGGPLSLPPPLWPPLVFAGLYFAQVAPIPMDLLGSLSPEAQRLWGNFPSLERATISVDPPATVLGLAGQAAFVGLLVATFVLGRRGLRAAVRALILTGSVVAVASLVHQAQGGTPGWPLPDADTLAGVLTLAGVVAVGLAGHSTDPWQRLQALAAAGICLAGVGLSGSVSGAAALLVGLVIFTTLAHVGGQSVWRARLVSYAALVFAVVCVAQMWLAPDLGPAAGAGPAASLPAERVYSFWLTGCGDQCARFVGPVPDGYLARVAIESGLGAVLLLVAAGLWTLRWLSSDLEAGRPLDWALVGALVGVGLQQFFDGGAGGVGITLPLAVALGIAIGRAQARRPRAEGRLAPPVLSALALAGLALMCLYGPTLPKRQIEVAYQKAETNSLAEHPADVRLPLMMAVQHARAGAAAEELDTLFEQARFRDPMSHLPHLVEACVFAPRDSERAAAALERAKALAPQLTSILDSQGLSTCELRHGEADPKPVDRRVDTPAPVLRVGLDRAVESLLGEAVYFPDTSLAPPHVAPAPDVPEDHGAVAKGPGISIPVLSSVHPPRATSRTPAPVRRIPQNTSNTPLGDARMVDRPALTEALERYRRRLNHCYERSVRLQPGLGGRVKVQLTLDGAGKVTQAEVVDDTLGDLAGDRSVGECIVSNLRRASLPATSEGPATLAYTFVFAPRERAVRP